VKIGASKTNISIIYWRDARLFLSGISKRRAKSVSLLYHQRDKRKTYQPKAINMPQTSKYPIIPSLVPNALLINCQGNAKFQCAKAAPPWQSNAAKCWRKDIIRFRLIYCHYYFDWLYLLVPCCSHYLPVAYLVLGHPVFHMLNLV
jgi:hypothetical protein